MSPAPVRGRAGALVLTLPMPENAANRASGRSHWRTIHRAREGYKFRCTVLLRRGEIPAPPSVPLARAALRVTMHLGGHMDDDNAAARCKVALDWMVEKGYLASDRRTCLTWEGFPEQIVKRDGNYRLVLTLTPVEG